MSTALLRALKIILAKDSSSSRSESFHALRMANSAVRFAQHVYATAPSGAKSILLLAYGLRTYHSTTVWSPSARTATSIASVHCYENERRALAWFKELLGIKDIVEFRITSELAGLRSLVKAAVKGRTRPAYVSTLPKLFRLALRIQRRHPFSVSCRAIATIFLYLYFKDRFRKGDIRLLLVASETNPHALAACAAGGAAGVRSMLLPHGFPVPPYPRLRHDYCVFQGRADKEAFEKAGPITGECFFIGLPCAVEERRALIIRTTPPRKIAVLLSLVTRVERLEALLAGIQKSFPASRVVVRVHPNSWENSFLRARVDLPKTASWEREGTSLGETLADCDLGFAGNSAVHLESLARGIPMLYEFGLDPDPRDLFGFVASGLLFEAPAGDIDLKSLKTFYCRKAWVDRLSDYDSISERAETCWALRKRVIGEIP